MPVKRHQCRLVRHQCRLFTTLAALQREWGTSIQPLKKPTCRVRRILIIVKRGNNQKCNANKISGISFYVGAPIHYSFYTEGAHYALSHYCAPWWVCLRHSHYTMSASTLFTLNRERAYAIRIVAYATHLVKSYICWFCGFSCFHFTSAFTSPYKSYFISRVSFDINY